MAQNPPVTLTILGKEYMIACPPGEDASLRQAGEYLNSKMREIRVTGRVVGADRIAVMAALNIAHELLNEKQKNIAQHTDLSDKILALQNQIKLTLNVPDKC